MPKAALQNRQYELTYVIPVGYTDSEVAQIKKEIEDLAKKRKGAVTKVEDWGKRSLSYRIKKGGKTHEEAVYIYTELSFDPAQAQAFERDIYLNTKLLRHLFVIASGEAAVAESTSAAVEE